MKNQANPRGWTNSLRPPLAFGQSAPRTPKLLVAVVILAATVLTFLVGTYVAEIPPAHLLIIVGALVWLFWGARKQ